MKVHLRRTSDSQGGCCMSKVNRLRLAVSTGALLALGMVAQPSSAIDYDVTITNLTANVAFTPIVLATHRPANLFYWLGEPASVPLEALAEGGETAPLLALL